MMKEAESHSDEDKKRREEIETRNRADQAVYAAERMLRDTGDKVGASDRQAVESAIQDLKTAVSGTDTGAITRAMDQLMSAQHKAAEALYKQASTARAESAGGGGPKGDGAAAPSGGPKDDVIDAEVVDDKQ